MQVIVTGLDSVFFGFSMIWHRLLAGPITQRRTLDRAPKINETQITRLTMRLSDAGLRQHPTKLIYPNHRLSSLANRRRYPRDRSNRLLDHLENHKTGGSTFFASRRRNWRIRHSTNGIIVEGAPTNPTMNHRHSGVIGNTTSLWMAHILPANTSHGVGCATDVSRIGTISGRWAERRWSRRQRRLSTT